MNANPFRDLIAEPKIAHPAPASVQPSEQKPVSAIAECGSGWYHEVAIKEAKKTPVRQH